MHNNFFFLKKNGKCHEDIIQNSESKFEKWLWNWTWKNTFTVYPPVARVSHWQQISLPCFPVHLCPGFWGVLQTTEQQPSPKAPTVAIPTDLETRVPLFLLRQGRRGKMVKESMQEQWLWGSTMFLQMYAGQLADKTSRLPIASMSQE